MQQQLETLSKIDPCHFAVFPPILKTQFMQQMETYKNDFAIYEQCHEKVMDTSLNLYHFLSAVAAGAPVIPEHLEQFGTHLQQNISTVEDLHLHIEAVRNAIVLKSQEHSNEFEKTKALILALREKIQGVYDIVLDDEKNETMLPLFILAWTASKKTN
jgi:hypothetical protein